MIDDGTATQGRKGIPYDWQALLASQDSEHHAEVERELVAIGD